MQSVILKHDMNSSVLYKVTPFDRFALGTCYEYNFIPMYTYFGGTEFEYFVNKLTYCHYTNDKFCITIKDLRDESDLLAAHGLKATYINKFENDILNKILTSLDKGKLIMIRTSNVESYEVATGYQTEKSTSEHWISCFGYNLETQEIDILEHRTNISAKYNHCRIKFEKIVDAYLSVNTPDEEQLGIVILEKESDIDVKNNYKETYISERKEYQECFNLSNESIFRMMKGLRDIAEKSDDFDEDYVLIFTELLKYYQREIWLLDGIRYSFDSGELIKQLNLVRSLVMKCTLYPSDSSYNRLCDHVECLKVQMERFNAFVNNVFIEEGVGYEL